VARDDDLWMPPPDAPGFQPLVGYPPYPASPVPSPHVEESARRAARKAWLERRFPERTTAGRARRGRWRLAWECMLGVAAVGYVAWLVVLGLPDPDAPSPAWLDDVMIPLIGAWAVGAAALAVLTRRPPRVSSADVEILARLTAAERRELIRDLRTAQPPDPDLDVLAAAWMKDRWAALLQWPWLVVLATSMILKDAPGPWLLLPVMGLATGLWALVEHMPRLLAARAWLRRARA
jgi:hypothetical protein